MNGFAEETKEQRKKRAQGRCEKTLVARGVRRGKQKPEPTHREGGKKRRRNAKGSKLKSHESLTFVVKMNNEHVITK